MDNGDSTYLIGCGELNNCACLKKKKKDSNFLFAPLSHPHQDTQQYPHCPD